MSLLSRVIHLVTELYGMTCSWLKIREMRPLLGWKAIHSEQQSVLFLFSAAV